MSLGDSLRRAAGLPRASYGMTVAHLGLAIAVAGVTGGALWETESIQIMKPGEQVTVAGYDITFVGVEDVRGPNYLAERGTFTVARDGERIAIMQPEKRRYVVSRQDTTEAAIRTNGIYDLYLVLGESNGKGGWATRTGICRIVMKARNSARVPTVMAPSRTFRLPTHSTRVMEMK